MENLNKFSKEKLMKLLAIITLSDGTISKSGKYLKSIKLSTIHYNKCQHDLFDYLCKKIFNKETKKYIYFNNGNKMITSRLFGKQYIEDLLKLSPSYQSSAGPNLSKKEYLNSPQPSLKFILNEKDDKIKQLALKIYFDFDGSIVPSFKIKNKKDKRPGKVYQYYQIQFECDINIAETNPNLIEELKIFCKMLNLNSIIIKDKRMWSKIGGIRISELNSVKRFINFIGPITNVKISSKSKRLKGVTKKAVCKGVLNLLNKNIPLSYHFKNREEALKKKDEMNKLLMSEIKKCI